MELASKYNPADVEGKWYQYWLDNKLLHNLNIIFVFEKISNQ